MTNNPTKKPKKRVVRAWGIVDKKDGIEIVSVIQSYGKEWHVLTFPTKKEARRHLFCGADKIVPVTITYTPPTK